MRMDGLRFYAKLTNTATRDLIDELASSNQHCWWLAS